MINSTPIPYKLEQHLQEICTAHPEYEDLLSVWHINKKACKDLLSNVILNYPHYTIHDLSHSESIITNIEMLLGEEAIRKLSPTDTWLLLQAAYLHDFGMVLFHQDIEEQWGSAEFQAYLESLRHSADPSLKKAFESLDSLGNHLHSEEAELSWPLTVRKNVTLIIADYYRRRHASLSKQYLSHLAKEWGLDLGFNGLIPQRLISLLGEIAYLHTEDSHAVLKLDYISNGFNSDYIHPRFAAQMLRMGDLLDADNNRFNPYTEKVAGESPASSRIHIKKHLSTRHLLVTPEAIEYRGDCPDEETYRETRNFLNWLKSETDFLALNWLDIMPRGLGGTAPRLRKTELLLRGVPDQAGITDLRFSISQEKAFDVIEGSNLYSDRFIFIREIIQNALDACKIQLWEDLLNQKYNAWLATTDYQSLSPFDIDNKIFENYKVQVRISEIDDKTIEIIVQDNGIGITVDTFKRMCQVGTSYEGDAARRREIQQMPAWLRPTAGFGIGLQSVFLVTDQFELYSNSRGKGIHAVVGSRKTNGYVQIHDSDRLKCNGTEIRIRLDKGINFSYSLVGKTYNYISGVYDPFAEKNQMLQYKILDEVLDHCAQTYFPLEVLFEDEVVQTVEPYRWDRPSKQGARYMYRWADGHSAMELWDNEKFAMLRYRLLDTFDHYGDKYKFKGIDISNKHRYRYKGISYAVDLYGLETKECITLDRKELRAECTKEVNQITEDGFLFFKEKIWEELEGCETIPDDFWGEDGPMVLYRYWCQVSLDRKRWLLERFAEAFERVKVPVSVFCRQKDGKYKRETIDFKIIFKDIENTACPNLSDWLEYANKKQNKMHLDTILKRLNQYKGTISYKYILAEEEFADILRTFSGREITVLKAAEHTPKQKRQAKEADEASAPASLRMRTEKKELFLISYSYGENWVLKAADKETEAYFLRGLVAEQPFYPNRGWLLRTVRCFIPALEMYAAAAVRRTPFGLSGCSIYQSSTASLISPITLKDAENMRCLSQKAFIEQITVRPDYQNLLSFIHRNQLTPDAYTTEEIDTCCRRLIADYYDMCQADLHGEAEGAPEKEQENEQEKE